MWVFYFPLPDTYDTPFTRYDTCMEIPQQKFKTPEEEIAFLREEIARREQDVLSRNREMDAADRDSVGKEVMREYAEHDPTMVLEKKHQLSPQAVAESHGAVEMAPHKVEEIVHIAYEKGIRNAMSVLERMNDPFLADEVHRELVRLIRNEKQVADLKEGMPLWKVLNMSLFEVALPHQPDESKQDNIKAIFAAMEQFYSGMQTISARKSNLCYTLEIAVSDKSDDIIFYIAVPNEFANLFEKHALSLFPHAVLRAQQNDYNIFVEGGTSMVSVLELKKHPIYPLKLHETFEKDPLNVILNAFSKIERDGGGASIQIVVGDNADAYHTSYSGIVKRMEKGEKAEVSIRKSSIGGQLFEMVKDMASDQKKKDDLNNPDNKIDTEKIEIFGKKILSPVVDTNIRLAVSASTQPRAQQILTELESCFNQFQEMKGNQCSFKRLSGSKQQKTLRDFSFREFDSSYAVPLSLTELSTIIHFPAEGIESTPQFKQSRAKGVSAPLNLPNHGTLLGENDYRNVTTNVFLTPADRLRHFYVIGQTGTGKTTLIKNMVIQDIQEGAGVCFIDPHGTDIMHVISAIPPERIDDVIYFDPSNLETSLGLNMLEFDERMPEQKTFIVNELLSIFQKLYGANPESMGPMFEQYFRNSTLLVLEDPASGSTLLDISRVMADPVFRARKLAKATNPVVKQFWEKIATKAGGDQSLENFVPYITSKIDPLTANDYIRPIIGQQKSSFNFRDIMDTKKILLVNLSKGRLGELNANLIGMVIVGKILMAALSRVDDPTQSFPPFYLYIDEFQNVTTDSISSILSEARKYKLGLTVAHQFIAQLDEKIRDAVFGNVGSMAVFRVGTEDAAFLEKQFAPTFLTNDLMNIENRNAYVRILADGTPTQPFNLHTMKPVDYNAEYAQQIIEYSSLKHGTPRAVVDAAIKARYL